MFLVTMLRVVTVGIALRALLGDVKRLHIRSTAEQWNEHCAIYYQPNYLGGRYDLQS